MRVVLFRVMLVVGLMVASGGALAAERAGGDAVSKVPGMVLAPARARCGFLALGMGMAVAFPGIIPLWTAGAAKGLAIANGFTDIVAQTRTPPGLTHDPSRARAQLERNHLWFLALGALTGSVIATGLLWPPFAVLVVGVVVMLTQTTDTLGTGLCSEGTKHEARPIPQRLRTLAIAAGLFAVAAATLPLTLLPTAVGALLVMISIGLAPAFPLIPGLGFIDLPAAFKRAGVLQTASWPMVYVAASAAGVALTLLVLEATRPSAGSVRAE